MENPLLARQPLRRLVDLGDTHLIDCILLLGLFRGLGRVDVFSFVARDNCK